MGPRRPAAPAPERSRVHRPGTWPPAASCAWSDSTSPTWGHPRHPKRAASSCLRPWTRPPAARPSRLAAVPMPPRVGHGAGRAGGLGVSAGVCGDRARGHLAPDSPLPAGALLALPVPEGYWGRPALESSLGFGARDPVETRGGVSAPRCSRRAATVCLTGFEIRGARARNGNKVSAGILTACVGESREWGDSSREGQCPGSAGQCPGG